ncbi:MAG: hypothetical protein AB8F74_11750 [Saprospiraceae bacterium]
MKRIITYLLPVVSCVLFFACQQNSDTINIKDYYYPAERLTNDGLVYEYRALNNDSVPPEYWYFRSLETDTALYFTGTYYDEYFNVRQFFSSEIVGNGVLLVDQFISTVDTTDQLVQYHADVLYNNVFPFEVRDSGGIFLMKLKFTFNEDPPATTTLTRNRRYIGKGTYKVEGEEEEIVIMELKEEVDDQNNGHWTSTYDGVEYYAEGIGLVYYKKEVDENFVLEYGLHKRYPMSELEKKFSRSLTNE